MIVARHAFVLAGFFLIGATVATGLAQVTSQAPATNDSDLKSKAPRNPALDQLLLAIVSAASTDKVFHQTSDAQKVGDLLARGADPNAKDSRGTPALTWALNFGKDDVARLLIRYGADCNTEDAQGRNAAWLAAMIYYCPGSLDLMIKKGVKITGVDKSGRTFIYAITSAAAAVPGKMNFLHDRAWSDAEFKAYQEREHRTVDLLVAAGVGFKGQDGTETPLMKAITTGHVEAARALIENGAVLSYKNVAGDSALSLAKENCPELVPLLEAHSP